jgi:uncharacterized protein (TIGR02001 family)
MKTRFAMAGAAGALLAASVGSMNLALAEGPHSVSANIGVVSNYMWRGQTQTQDDPAVQGGLDYAHESGFSAGTWVSNVDFGGDSDDFELDLYAGYDFSISEDISVGVSGIYYAYPSDDFDGDFAELGISGGYKWFSLGIQYTVWADDDVEGLEDSVYYYGGAEFELPYGLGLGLRLGYYDYDDGAVDDPVNWGVSLSKGAGDFGTFSLNYDQLDSDDFDSDPKFWVGWLKEF